MRKKPFEVILSSIVRIILIFLIILFLFQMSDLLGYTSSWNIVNVLDDFGDKTNEKELVLEFKGHFANETRKSKVCGEISFRKIKEGKLSVSIRLWNYCRVVNFFLNGSDKREPVIGSLIGENFTIGFKSESEKLFFDKNWYAENFIKFNNREAWQLVNLFKKCNKVKVVIKSDMQYLKYNFTLNCRNFVEEFSSFISKE